jgi:hypothetical protein
MTVSITAGRWYARRVRSHSPALPSSTGPTGPRQSRTSTADCIDTDPPTGRGYSGQSGNPLIEMAHVHHATWVMFTEKPPVFDRCRRLRRGD